MDFLKIFSKTSSGIFALSYIRDICKINIVNDLISRIREKIVGDIFANFLKIFARIPWGVSGDFSKKKKNINKKFVDFFFQVFSGSLFQKFSWSARNRFSVFLSSLRNLSGLRLWKIPPRFFYEKILYWKDILVFHMKPCGLLWEDFWVIYRHIMDDFLNVCGKTFWYSGWRYSRKPSSGLLWNNILVFWWKEFLWDFLFHIRRHEFLRNEAGSFIKSLISLLRVDLSTSMRK